MGAFCALSPTGAHCWGAKELGGDAAVAHRLRGVSQLCANDYAFAAVTEMGLVAWGDEERGGETRRASKWRGRVRRYSLKFRG